MGWATNVSQSATITGDLMATGSATSETSSVISDVIGSESYQSAIGSSPGDAGSTGSLAGDAQFGMAIGQCVGMAVQAISAGVQYAYNKMVLEDRAQMQKNDIQHQKDIRMLNIGSQKDAADHQERVQEIVRDGKLAGFEGEKSAKEVDSKVEIEEAKLKEYEKNKKLGSISKRALAKAFGRRPYPAGNPWK